MKQVMCHPITSTRTLHGGNYSVPCHRENQVQREMEDAAGPGSEL